MAAWYTVECALLCEPCSSHVMIKQPLALPDPLRLSNFLPRLVVSGSHQSQSGPRSKMYKERWLERCRHDQMNSVAQLASWPIQPNNPRQLNILVFLLSTITTTILTRSATMSVTKMLAEIEQHKLIIKESRIARGKQENFETRSYYKKVASNFKLITKQCVSSA
jgi:hypothetical protein